MLADAIEQVTLLVDQMVVNRVAGNQFTPPRCLSCSKEYSREVKSIGWRQNAHDGAVRFVATGRRF
jgi:hypothetical protein